VRIGGDGPSRQLLVADSKDFGEFGLHSWDTAAGVLLVREAGGIATRFDGQRTAWGSRAHGFKRTRPF